ncbi:hypothetical protein MFIFM68171_09692 [Madurella fahalii]|uniref:Uncharacterized protein n=1 Tax=Madurella fahalii TaxID=1157608 RepID=A0ABQ0GP26_9PEZI
MEALKHLVANIPDWLKRLEELDGRVAQRQKDLAQLTKPQSQYDPGVPSATRSLRNKGSQESLRPRDEPEAHPREATPQPEVAPMITSAAPAAGEQPAPGSPSEPQSPSAIARQTSQARAAGQARARAVLCKQQRSDSVISAEGAAPKRTRRMIVVYYDSYAQVFFEELVKFVSASRNMMRKAKMVAKMAQIKRLAELEMPGESDEEKAEPSTPSPADGSIAPLEAGEAEEKIPSFRYMSARGMQSPGLPMAQAALGRSMYSRAGMRTRDAYGRGGMGPPGPDPLEKNIYDDLDKGLEDVQSTCEHAAHQVLRDGDCAEEVEKISRRMTETMALADRELERVQREDLETLKAAEDESCGRIYRPPSMRKNLTSSCSHRSDIKDGSEGYHKCHFQQHRGWQPAHRG